MKRLLLPLLGIIPLFTMAGGFQVNLQGTKQTGMGHLGTSFYLGASSTYFNPAMMGLDSAKFNIELGLNVINSSVQYQNQSTGVSEFTDNPNGTPFYFYATYKINEDLAAGIGVYTPFGSSVKWGDDWSGKNLIQDISLRAIFIQPTLSYKITDQLSAGAGLTIVSGAVEINRAIPAPVGNNDNAAVNLEGDALAYGFNAGIHFQATDQLSIGITHRSSVDVELEGGSVDFTTDPLLATSFPDGEFSATLPLPATNTLGLAYMVNEKLLISAEASFVQWSDYKSLDFDFENNTPSLPDSENPRNYEDAFIYRLGAQYMVNESITGRIGAYYDESPIQDEFFNPETPNTNNLGATAGITGNINESFSVDASFLFIYGFERESEYAPQNFGGKYAARSVILGLGLNYKL